MISITYKNLPQTRKNIIKTGDVGAARREARSERFGDRLATGQFKNTDTLFDREEGQEKGQKWKDKPPEPQSQDYGG